MRPAEALADHRNAVPTLSLSARYGLRNARICGPAARGDDRDGCHLDLLVEAIPELTTLLDIVGMTQEAGAMPGVPVVVRTLEDIHQRFDIDQRFRARVVRDARPL